MAQRAIQFGPGPRIALDREAKVRIMAHARAWTARHRQPGQHRGPLTRATIEVLQALLWRFHNAHTGACFPSLSAIAKAAECCRDTVCEAIKALERAGILTWVHRIVRERVREPDLFGRSTWRWRVLRTSNAYTFRDPRPSTSENPAGQMNQGLFVPVAVAPRPLAGPLAAALSRLGDRIGERLLGKGCGGGTGAS